MSLWLRWHDPHHFRKIGLKKTTDYGKLWRLLFVDKYEPFCYWTLQRVHMTNVGNTQKLLVWFKLSARWLTDISMPPYLFLFLSQQITVVCEHQEETGCDVRREFSYSLMEDRDREREKAITMGTNVKNYTHFKDMVVHKHTTLAKGIHTNAHETFWK